MASQSKGRPDLDGWFCLNWSVHSTEEYYMHAPVYDKELSTCKIPAILITFSHAFEVEGYFCADTPGFSQSTGY